nr:myosin IC heavy chain-like [Globicephala melas]
MHPRSGHRPRQAAGPGLRRGAAGGATRCRRPPLAPPGPRHALRPSAAAGAGELGGSARPFGLLLRHPPCSGDLLAGGLGAAPPPGGCSLRRPGAAPARARRLRPGEGRNWIVGDNWIPEFRHQVFTQGTSWRSTGNRS